MPPERLFLQEPHGITSQNMVFFSAESRLYLHPTRPDRHWVPTDLVPNAYGGQARQADHSPPRAGVKNGGATVSFN
jgi:hypothetical protein